MICRTAICTCIAVSLSTSALTAPASQAETLSVSVDMNNPQSVARFFEHAVKVAPHVWALHAVLSAGPAPLANEMVVEQHDGLVLIDAGKTRGAGERIVALIRSISSKPVKAVIITHWHQDHYLGLGPVIEAWPGIPIITNVGTAEEMAKDPGVIGAPRKIGETAARDKAREAILTQYARDFAHKVHDPKLTPAQHQGYGDLVGVLGQRIADERGSYVVPPTVTSPAFNGSTTRWFRSKPLPPAPAIPMAMSQFGSPGSAWSHREIWLSDRFPMAVPTSLAGRRRWIG